ncbi:MAG: peptidoglycan synthetase [Bacteroidetes bacterium]|nr:peptidoglycan synthetase [Bacteroidota bacterium]MBV6460027.1 UDP-N-acetylmuramate--L-alanyl-gamma-D-glutamyl-meso-2,6-diaminoheptandioate ligase [Flavobacteriales bacterium]WKZ76645.1 MAG: Mur ligase family protein [Vicingaceae bacterium]MCL4816377.1 peptidoglycan synthetase [Flavobacteriales bacterium]NOG95452.1 peptidoglycan synthetase [Bacteroidota bacterium]
MRIHFIAIGGSAMHNLAIALHKKGYEVTGSDDEIFEPSKTRLQQHGLLPSEYGWFPEKLNSSIEAVILGMHARSDNPELLKAQQLGLRIFSYPEYIFEQSKNKTRIVIGGSHGKTTITSMLIHVLTHCNISFDFMVGAQLQGFDTMVQLSEAPLIVLEGDEYLSSPIDRRPKFHLYKPHIALLSGIAWDHINVFPTFEIYVEQFKLFIETIEKNGTLVYYKEDEVLQKLAHEKSHSDSLKLLPYSTPAYEINNGITYLLHENKKTALEIFGKHNLQNIEGTMQICLELGIHPFDFYSAISSFKGASKRLELISKNETTAVYKDFAHSPSKLKATVAAVKEQYPHRNLIACMELHTFSSLNPTFLNQYQHTMNDADMAFVYYNPHTIEHKKLPPISKEQVKKAFESNTLQVFTNSAELKNTLLTAPKKNTVFLLMTSGNFDGIDLDDLGNLLIAKTNVH